MTLPTESCIESQAAMDRIHAEGWTNRPWKKRTGLNKDEAFSFPFDHAYRLTRKGEEVFVIEPYGQDTERLIEQTRSQIDNPSEWLIEAKPGYSTWNPPQTIAIWIQKNSSK
jgi:hypothetical protein